MRFILISTRPGSISTVLFIIDPLRLKTGKLKHPRGFLNPRRDSLRTVLFNYRVTGKLADSGKPEVDFLAYLPYRKMLGERHTLRRCVYPSQQSFFPPTILFYLGRCRCLTSAKVAFNTGRETGNFVYEYESFAKNFSFELIRSFEQSQII